MSGKLPVDLKRAEEIIEKITGEYVLIEDGENLPVCKGCFNEHEPCGTPCTSCERHEAWFKAFIPFTYLFNLFTIYKRKNKKEKNAE